MKEYVASLHLISDGTIIACNEKGQIVDSKNIFSLFDLEIWPKGVVLINSKYSVELRASHGQPEIKKTSQDLQEDPKDQM